MIIVIVSESELYGFGRFGCSVGVVLGVGVFCWGGGCDVVGFGVGYYCCVWGVCVEKGV